MATTAAVLVHGRPGPCEVASQVPSGDQGADGSLASTQPQPSEERRAALVSTRR